MMEQFSPPIRKFVAVGILLFLVLLALLCLATLFSSLGATLERLQHYREKAQKLETVKATPEPDWPPLLDRAMTIHAVDIRGARNRFSTILIQLGRRFNVELSATAPPSPTMVAPALITANLTVKGNQQAVLGFIAALEGGAPLMRFQRVSLTAVPGTAALPPATPPAAASPPISMPAPAISTPAIPAGPMPPNDPFAGASPGSPAVPPFSPPTADMPAQNVAGIVQLEAIVEAVWSGS